MMAARRGGEQMSNSTSVQARPARVTGRRQRAAACLASRRGLTDVESNTCTVQGPKVR
jgi:hypothetical protein